ADRAEGAPDRAADTVLEEPDRAVAHQPVDPAGMVAIGVDRGEDRPALVLVDRHQVPRVAAITLEDDLGVRGVGRGYAAVEDAAVGPGDVPPGAAVAGAA